MLEGIRRQMPRQAMLTTECNGEPFVRWFDGYLTWHWQHDGQVPAFPAVYGEAIRMFGRAYRGGATKDLALRMKAGQQLVFGEQPGWLDPGLIQEPENAAFFRQIVRLRAALEPGFPAGEMARPPRLEGGVPQVRADWQWSGEWFVATPAVLTGAWRSSRDRRLYLLFVNVGDGAVSATLDFRASEYGVSGSSVRLRTIGPGTAAAPPPRLPATFKLPLVSPPREAFAWELAW
jgi:hypothetical protein